MTQVDVIRRELEEHIGKMVILKANKGRKRIVTRRGVLEAVYPSVFIVNIGSNGSDGYQRNVSFTFSDILTSTVQVTIVDEVPQGECSKLKIS